MSGQRRTGTCTDGILAKEENWGWRNAAALWPFPTTAVLNPALMVT